MGFFKDLAQKHGLTGGVASMKHVNAGAAMVREVGEGVVVGGLLGAAHALMPTGLDLDGKVPLDGVLAGLGVVGGVMMAHEDFGQDMRNIGASASTILSFRKSYAFAASRKMANTKLPPESRIPGDRVQEQNVALAKANKAAQLAAAPTAKVAGDFGFGVEEDPIVAQARAL